MKKILFALLWFVSGLTFSQSMHLDTTFNGIGTGVYSYEDYEQAHDAATYPDSKIIISGYTTGTPQGLLLLRLNSNGTIDSTFGDDGFVVGASNNSPQGSGDKVIIQPDGGIIANGRYIDGDGDRNLTLFKYNYDGSPDATFGLEGRLVIDLGFSCHINDLALQPDGKILFAGKDFDNYGNSLVGRINIDGTLDNTFNADGYTFIEDVDEDDGEHAFLLQPDGKIIFGGINGEDIDGDNDIKICRFNSDGSPDLSFGDAGIKVIDFFDGFERLQYMHLNADGSIYVYSGTCGGEYALILHKLDSDGSFDETFGIGGTLTYENGELGNYYLSVASYIENKIIFGGGNGHFSVLRLNSDGTRDNSFFVEGEAEIDLSIDGDDGNIVLAEANGNILNIGTTYVSGDGEFSVMRLALDTALIIDTTTTEISFIPINFPSISITPNPSQNIFTINSTEPISEIEVINLKGEILINKLFSNTLFTTSINIEDLQDGLYIVRIYNQGKVVCKKMVISK